MLYFAYGSNMCEAKLAKAAKGATFQDVGHVEGYELRFHKQSSDGSGKGDAYAAAGRVVWGVLYDVPEASWGDLVESEDGYDQVGVTVRTATQEITAWTFLAREDKIVHGLQPYPWYKRYVVEGARAHALPPQYLAGLESIATVPDNDRARVARREAVKC